jgi:hypothetical protein
VDPTPEQEKALDLFGTGDPLTIQAGAGAGKTTTLQLLARSTQRLGCYLSFNRAIANEAARKMPMFVQSSTMHSLAMRAVGYRLRHRLDAPRIPGWKLAKLMGVSPVVLQVGARSKMMQPGYLAGHVMKAIARFCQSGDQAPMTKHFPYIEGIDLHNADGTRGYKNNRELAKHLAPHLDTVWADLINPDGRLRFSHDVYLKLWQLQGGETPGDYVMLDEAQDANGVMLAVMAQAAAAGQQTVFVGDSQQQIYEWRGAVDALDLVEGNRAFLTQSFRFGPQIAEVANLILGELNAELRLTGTETIPSTVGPLGTYDAALCRTNATAVNTVLALQRRGLQPFLAGGADEIVNFARAAIALQNGERTYHPELACFDTWREVQQYVESDPQGDELRMMVHLLDEYGPQIVLDALAGLVGEDQADVVVSTAHKAKGREWGRVHIAADFNDGGEGGNVLHPSEWRLLYVACTRARQALDITWCKPVRDLLDTPEEVLT